MASDACRIGCIGVCVPDSRCLHATGSTRPGIQASGAFWNPDQHDARIAVGPKIVEHGSQRWRRLAVLAVFGVTAFVLVERRTVSPLLQIGLLKERNLSAGLAALALVSTIMMATLVVGPFYLARVLALGPVEAGLAMSVGPGVAALVGLPAGRLVDLLGSARVMIAGLLGVVAGSVLMTILPGWFGIVGYVASLSIITAGYALFQAANNTALMASVPDNRRGLTAALLGLARNLGLITGASAMGAVFAMGSNSLISLGLSAGPQTGMQITFGLAALLAGIALVLVHVGSSNKARLP